MSVHHIPLSALTAEHFNRLLGVPESKTCDYKSAPHPVHLEDKWQDFLSDLVAFANADGGDIVYGIEEGEGDQKGVATAIPGLNGFNKDDWVSRAEQRMKVRIHPNLTGVRFHPVDVGGRQVLVVRIPRSHMAPHAVKLDKGQHFCTRGEQGKVELDVTGIRSAFLASEGLADKLRAFRNERIAVLFAQVLRPSGQDLCSCGTLVVHILPCEAARPGFSLESASLLEVKSRNNPNFLMSHSGYGPRFNYDGLSFVDDSSGQRVSLFRKGFLEVVNAQLAQRRQGVIRIPFQEIERRILQTLPAWLEDLELVGFSGPFLVSLSMLGVSGAIFTTAQHFVPVNHQTKIDRDALLSDEVEVPLGSSPTQLAEVMKPIFDQFWNAVGAAASPSYTEAGVCKLIKNAP